jgi:hypothetical protein
MRITIKHEQNLVGLINKKPVFIVKVQAQFSAEEQAAIQSRGLEDIIIASVPDWRGNDNLPQQCSPRLMASCASFAFSDFVEARNFDGEIKRSISNLKGVIDEAIRFQPGQTETYEL